MQVMFHTNLDAPQPDIGVLNRRRRSLHEPIPRKGEQIEFSFMKDGRRASYTLEVVGVTYNYMEEKVVVELHMPAVNKQYQSIADWSKWFDKFRFGRE